MERAKWSGIAWGFGAIFIALILAGGFNWIVDLLPPATETKLAKKIPVFDDSSCKPSKEAESALEKIRKRLVRPGDEDFSMRFQVVRDSEVNAFAFLGGAIYINSGLLHEAFNADEVAGVIAHEMSHVRNRDVLHGMAGQLLTAFLFAQVGDSTVLTKIFTHAANLKYTRTQEEAADRGAIARLQAAHISTQPLANFFKRLPSLGAFANAMLSDHPDSIARSQMAAAAKVEDAHPVLEDNEWQALKSTCQNEK
jgi:predicted Zn-dependent protease